MTYRKTALGVLLAANIGGFGVSPGKAQDTAQPGKTEQQVGNSATEKAGPVTVTVTTDKKLYAAGTTIKLTLTVRNTSPDTVHLTFSSGQRFDFVIRHAVKGDSPILWQWSRGKMFTQMLSSDTLMPGQDRTYTTLFDPKEAAQSDAAKAGKPAMFAPGPYTVSGTLTISSREARPSATAVFRLR